MRGRGGGSGYRNVAAVADAWDGLWLLLLLLLLLLRMQIPEGIITIGIVQRVAGILLLLMLLLLLEVVMMMMMMMVLVVMGEGRKVFGVFGGGGCFAAAAATQSVGMSGARMRTGSEPQLTVEILEQLLHVNA